MRIEKHLNSQTEKTGYRTCKLKYTHFLNIAQWYLTLALGDCTYIWMY